MARRGRGRARGAALAVGIGALTLLIVPAGAAAAVQPAESGVEVAAHMTASSDRPSAGDTVVVDLTLTNTGTSSARVLVDEVIGGVLDDARMEVAADASSASVAVIRLGHDRLALSGRLDPGQVVTVDYTVVILPEPERGDGVLSRVAVAPDDTAPPCADMDAQDASSGLGDCTAIVLAGAHVESVEETSAGERTAVSATGALAASVRSSRASDASGVSAAGDDGTPVAAAVGPIPAALVGPLVIGLVVVVALLTLAVVLTAVRRARRRRARRDGTRRIPAGRVVLAPRPASAPVRPVSPPPAASTPARPVNSIRPIPPVVHFESRRERRVAERRLAERGLALPVA